MDYAGSFCEEAQAASPWTRLSSHPLTRLRLRVLNPLTLDSRRKAKVGTTCAVCVRRSLQPREYISVKTEFKAKV